MVLAAAVPVSWPQQRRRRLGQGMVAHPRVRLAVPRWRERCGLRRPAATRAHSGVRTAGRGASPTCLAGEGVLETRQARRKTGREAAVAGWSAIDRTKARRAMTWAARAHLRGFSAAGGGAGASRTFSCSARSFAKSIAKRVLEDHDTKTEPLLAGSLSFEECRARSFRG